jgi:hypothetical protein
MLLSVWLARIARELGPTIPRGRSNVRPKTMRRKPQVEQLEDRMVPSLFGPAANYNVGNGPYNVAIGDFNGDHKEDIVVANHNETDVSVLMGNGDGTFQPAQSIAVGSGPVFVVATDLNGDGFDDIVTGNNNSGDVSVLISNGNGTFKSAVNYASVGSVVGVAVGDLNGDGKKDIVAVSQSGVVSVFLGNGDGTFQAATNYGAGSLSREVALGDFNSDGHLDIAVANQGDNTVSLLINNGDGTFHAGGTFSVGSTPTSIKAADVNGDGKVDLITANFSSNDISVLLGNGDGTFQAAQNYSAGPNPHNIAIGDVNGDGKLDVAVAQRNGGLGILLGNGDGTFQAVQTFDLGSGSGPLGVALGDLNGDGKLDAVTADHDTNNISVLLNTNVTKPVTVTSALINDGSVQRSMVNSITIDFSGQVNISPGAFQLTRQGGGTENVLVATSLTNGMTVATLTFAGNDINGGSLPDGSYTLTILGDHIHDTTGQALDGAGNGSPGSNKVITFFRLFGDANGDGVVDQKDLALFNSTFKKKAGDPGFLWYFDFDGNGVIDNIDKKEFVLRLRA